MIAQSADKTTYNPAHIKYWIFWLPIGLLRLLVFLPYRTLLFLGKIVGFMLYLLSARMRTIARINIQLCFPELNERQQAQLVRRNFYSAGIAIFETALAWWGSEKKLKPLLHFHGLEHFREAEKTGKGILILGAHFTTLEMAGRLFAIRVKSVAAVYREHKLPFINYILAKVRKRLYQVYIERKNVRGILKALKKGEAVWLTPDIDGGKTEHLFIPFFKIPAATITAPARLAKLADTVTLASWYYRRDDGTGYDIHFSPVFENFPSEDLEQDLSRVNLMIENAVRQHPEQYLWQYMRFKTRPVGEKRFYRSARR